jgi:hypothetical protein
VSFGGFRFFGDQSTEPDDLAVKLNWAEQEIRRLNGRMASVFDGTDTLHPNTFVQSDNFSALPLRSVGLVGSTNQSIGDSSYNTLTYEQASSLSSGLSFYSYSEGIDGNTTAGTITITGQPEKSLFLVTGAVQWVVNSSGSRELRILDTAGDFTPVAQHSARDATVSITQSFAVVRQMQSSVSTIELQAWQNTGAALNITRRIFQATWLR